LKDPIVEEKLLKELQNSDQILVVDLAKRLNFNLDATLILLSKILQQKKTGGYITKDQKTYLSNRYVSETLTNLFKSK
jgi:hypothetical protein